MPNLRAPTCSVVVAGAALPTPAVLLALRCAELRHGAGVAAGIDAAMALMCSLSALTPEPFASVSCANSTMLFRRLRRALTRSSSLCSSATFACSAPRSVGFRCGELPLRGRDLGLNRGPARVQIALVSEQRLRRARRVGRVRLLHLRLAAQELGVRARKLERERDDAVRGLPVGIEDQQVARLRGGLLLDAEHAVPVHRLVENADDLVARHDGAGGERRRGRAGSASCAWAHVARVTERQIGAIRFNIDKRACG